MHRSLRLLCSALVTLTLVIGGSMAVVATASAATAAPTTTCSNDVDDTPGLGLICEVTVVNTITASGGSAKVTIRECHGAAGDPTADCSTTTTNLTTLVTNVDQCNSATNGGGGTLRCTVVVTNKFAGAFPTPTAVTVNQCDGSGDGAANTCDPFPATTSNATITQCNGSANGGTLVQLECTATGTTSAGLTVTINQCNGSTNGGGALVICSASIVNQRASASQATPRPGRSNTAPPTDVQDRPSSGTRSDGVPWALLALVTMIGAALATTTSRARTRRS